MKQKQEITRLEKKAVEHYGVHFKKIGNTPDLDLKTEEFKKKDEELFEQFLETMVPQRSVSDVFQTVNKNHK